MCFSKVWKEQSNFHAWLKRRNLRCFSEVNEFLRGLWRILNEVWDLIWNLRSFLRMFAVFCKKCFNPKNKYPSCQAVLHSFKTATGVGPRRGQHPYEKKMQRNGNATATPLRKQKCRGQHSLRHKNSNAGGNAPVKTRRPRAEPLRKKSFFCGSWFNFNFD